MNSFLFDANIFIQAHRLYYPLDVVVSFWEKIKYLAYNGNIVSIDKVKNEIYRNEDELTVWCKDNLPAGFFCKSSSVLVKHYAQIVQWTASQHNRFTQKALSDFLGSD